MPEIIAPALSREQAESAMFLDYAGGDKPFAKWLGAVDALVEARVGLGIFDLEDFMWRDAFDAEQTPADAAEAFGEAVGLASWGL